jgi:hypothetical protein
MLNCNNPEYSIFLLIILKKTGLDAIIRIIGYKKPIMASITREKVGEA